MAIVCVHGPLKQLAGGVSEHRVDGDTVSALLVAFEFDHPSLEGWILDERGLIRRHLNVFVNGELGRDETPVEADDRIEVLPAISGGVWDGD